MAQEQSQELPVEQQLSNGTEGDTEVKPSAACYTAWLITSERLLTIFSNPKRSRPASYRPQITKKTNKKKPEIHVQGWTVFALQITEV